MKYWLNMVSSKIKICIIALAAALVSCTNASEGRWSVEKAQEWWDATEWPVGCCYVPTYAINQLEMWQEDTFAPEVLDREFALCEDLGYNVVRIYLHELLWFQS